LATQDQDSIGWDQFLRGRVSKLWEDAQERWLVRIATKWKRSSSLWLTRLLLVTWEVSFAAWDFRNKILHDPLHPWKRQRIQDLDSAIASDFSTFWPQDFLNLDRCLFGSSADHMQVHHSIAQKEQWLESVAMARLRMSQSRTMAMSNARLLMRNWLIQAELVPHESNDTTTDNTNIL
jgi:hypothetical protein